MTYDPLCPDFMRPEDCDGDRGCAECFSYRKLECVCQCELISKVIAEERWYPRPVDLLREDTVSNGPAIGIGNKDTDIPDLECE